MPKKFQPKQLSEQTIVITDASNGIGIVTAKMAAARGARVVLSGKDKEGLEKCVCSIRENGGTAISVMADTAQYSEMVYLRNKALQEFHKIDTWINNASTSLFGYLLDARIEDEKKLFETNFWSAKIGSLVAVESMKETGGVLINFGSEISLAAQPLLGMYSASKQALKAFSDALRAELFDRDIPVEVCLIRPNAIDIPVSLAYETAEVILKCAESPERDVYVGGPARLSAIIDTFFPHVEDKKIRELKKENTFKNNLRNSLRELRKEDSH